MGDIERVVPGVSFMETGARLEVLPLFRIERGIERAVGQDGTKRTELLAIVMLIAHSPLTEQLGVFLLSQRICQQREIPVGDIIFQGMRNRIIILFAQGDVAFAHIVVIVRAEQVELSGSSSALAHPFVGSLDIVIAQTAHISIHDIRDRRIAFHRQRLASVQFPLREPSAFLVHVDHGADDVELFFGIEQCHQCADIAVGVPERKDRIAVSVRMADFQAFHHRIFAIHVLDDVRMDQQVVHGGIENRLIVVRPAFHHHTRQIVVPHLAGCRTHFVEIEIRLFGVHIQAGIFDADKRDTHLYFDHFVFFGIILEPDADVVTAHLTVILRVQFIFAGIGIPFGFHSLHLALFLPVAGLLGGFAELHHEIDRENSLRVIAERTEQLASLYLRIAHHTNGRTGFIRQPFPQIQEDIPLPFRESKTCQAGTHGGGSFRLDVIFRQDITVIAGMGHLVLIFTTVFVVIHIQLPRGRHQQQASHLRTTDTAQIDVRITGEEIIVRRIRRGPPLAVLIKLITFRPHHIEGGNTHHSLRTNRTGIGRPVVACPDKRIHIIYRLLRGNQQRTATQ